MPAARGTPGLHGAVTITDDTVTYTPSTDWVGVDTFTYTVNDGVHTATATVTVEVGDSGPLVRISRPGVGLEGNDDSFGVAISGDGRYVAFASDASNLVADDTNGATDVFVYDRQAGTLERVSVGADAVQADGASREPVISADGRYVAFTSDATNLVTGDTNGEMDVFVRDRVAGTTTRVSVASDGTQSDAPSWAPSISADGQRIAFLSDSTLLVTDANTYADVFVHDLQTANTIRVTMQPDLEDSNGGNYVPVISGDGRYVAFTSDATNLVAGDTNGKRDLFRYDLDTLTMVRVMAGADEADGDTTEVAISYSGNVLAFVSDATNLVVGDTNGVADVFVVEMTAGTITRDSVAANGTQGDAQSWEVAISGDSCDDGRYLLFTSDATNLVTGDTNGACDVFLRDLQTGLVTRVSLANSGVQGNDDSHDLALSSTGIAAFASRATNLVPNDLNDRKDVFTTPTR